jgi:hypothetical protein
MASLYLITGWPSLGATCVSPAVFLAFEVGEPPSPERSEGERGGGRNPLPQRPQKTRDDSIVTRGGHPVIKYASSWLEGPFLQSLHQSGGLLACLAAGSLPRSGI